MSSILFKMGGIEKEQVPYEYMERSHYVVSESQNDLRIKTYK